MPKACILSVSGPDLTPEERKLFSRHAPWGAILMGRSCVSPEQVRRLVQDLHDAAGHECLVFTDQEGGRVARLKSPNWPVFPPARRYGELFARSREQGLRAAWLGHRLMAAELAAIRILADCAPVADIPVPGAHDVIGDRAFAQDAEAVAELALSALDGLRAGGVAGVIKHMPGHGRSTSDTHLELPRVAASLEELAADFGAFAALRSAPMGLTAHIVFEAVDPDRPATLSATVIGDVIRSRIGFDGLLMTDDLGMNALGGTLAERGVAAISAGCDVLLHCSGFVRDPAAILAEMDEVAGASPDLKGEALRRAGRALSWARQAEPFDAEAGWQEFAGLISGVGAVS